MKINLPSKFVPNFLRQQQEEFDDYHSKPIASPFRPLDNILFSSLEKNDRKSRNPKTFLEDQSGEEGNGDINIDMQAVNEVKIENQCAREEQKMAISDPIELGIKKSNCLKMVQFGDIAYEDSKYTPINHDSTTQEIVLPAFKIAANLQNDNWSNSSDSNEQPQNKVTAETKTNKSILIEKPVLVQLTKEKLFEKINGTMRCLLRRDKKSPSGFIEYNIYLQGSLQHIMTVRKEGVWEYCLYLRERNSGGFFEYSKVATLQSNFLGNKYTLIRHKEKHSSVTICYETNLLGLSGPRKFFTYLPKTHVPYEYLNEAYQSEKWKKHVEKCVSRTAKWNEKVQSYVLNFQGRASQSSIKNFVVTDKEELEENNFIIFGKSAPDVYNLDIQAPFSLIQGAAVALTSFERKLTCD